MLITRPSLPAFSEIRASPAHSRSVSGEPIERAQVGAWPQPAKALKVA
jgi:hypothetical protein